MNGARARRAFTAAHGWASRHRRRLLAATAALAVAWALYLLAANLFLNTSIGERTVNQRPERFHAEWRWAVSLYPGHVHARDVRLQGRARATGWEGSASRVSGRVRILPLLGRQVRIGWTRASDVVIVTDRDDRLSEEEAEALKRDRRSEGRPWSIRMDRIRSGSVTRLQFDRWRIDGDGTAAFGFSKVFRGGAFEMFPSRLDMPEVVVRNGEDVLFGPGRLTLGLALPAYVPGEQSGRDAVGNADASLHLDGPLPGLALQDDDDGRIGWRLEQPDGRLVADVELKRGELLPGGSVRAQTRLHNAVDDTAADDFALRVEADVTETGIDVRVELPEQAGHPAFVDARLHLAQRRPGAASTQQWLQAASGRVVMRWHFGALHWITPLLPAPDWLGLSGSADVDADLHLQAGALAAGSRASIGDAALRVEVLDGVVTGKAHLDAAVSDDDGELGTQVRVVAETFAIAARDRPDEQYVHGRDLKLDLAGSGDLAGLAETLVARLYFENARIPDLRAYNRYLPGDSLRFTGGSGTLGGDVQLDAAGEVVTGNLDLRGRNAGIRFGASELRGNLDLNGAMQRTQAGRMDYRVPRLQLRLRDVRLAGADDAPWWANIDLDGARLTWQQPFTVDSDVRLRMKDTSLLLSIFAERTAFPRWIGNFIDSGQVDATARARVEAQQVIVDDLQASNDRVDLFARLRIDGGQPKGDLYARWGVLGVAAELDDNERTLRTLGARDWYTSRPSLLPAR